MKIALIGATGAVGSRILTELLSRRHQVTALVRDPSKLKSRPGLTVRAVNAVDADSLLPHFRSQDAVISAFNAERGSPPYRDTVLKAYDAIFQAAKEAGVPRVLMVGGAGSLEVAPGKRLVDTPQFPEQFKTEALTFAEILNKLRRDHPLDWTYLSPAAFLAPGERTGRFRLGRDQFMTDAQGQSKISMEDLAVAMVDELEKHAHPRARFTAAY